MTRAKDNHHPRLVRAIEALAPTDGLVPTTVEGFWAFRAEGPTAESLFEYKLSLCVAAQGRKRVQFGNEDVIYDPLTCLLVALPIPLYARVIEASRERPFLAVVLDIDLSTLTNIVLDLDECEALNSSQSAAVRRCPVTAEFLDSVLRLTRAAGDQSDAQILGDSLKREVVYRLVQSPQGGLLRTLAANSSQTQRIQQIIRFMRTNLEKRLTIREIAASGSMSESSLYHIFKEVTSLSPLQYLKRVRLEKAREMMMDEGVNAGEAAYAVGYNSTSQFSREFKSMFGSPPSRVRSSDT